MDTGSPRKIQFTMPLLDSHLDPEAAEQIRRRRPTPATLVASSDQSSPGSLVPVMYWAVRTTLCSALRSDAELCSLHDSLEIDEDRLPNQLYKAALMNSPRQRRKGARATPTMKELQFMVDHHLYQQQQQQGGGDECSSESCLSDRPSPDALPNGEEEEEEELELPEDEEAWGTEDKVTAEALEKPRCQMEEFSRNSLSEATGGPECPLSEEEVGCSAVPMAATSSSQQQHALAAADTTAVSTASPLPEKSTKTPNQAKQDK